MRVNFGEIFQEKSKDRTMSGLVRIPSDTSLWPPSWKEVQYKSYDRFKSISLPEAIPRDFSHTDLVKRESVRDFGVFNKTTLLKECRKINLQQLSNILYYSCGEVKKSANPKNSKRIQASAGGRYPIEAYVLNFEKGGLDVKCYHYNVKDHSLEELWDIPLLSRKDINTYFGYDWVTDSSMAIVLTGVVARSVAKYGERAYKYMYLEAGVILNNLQNNTMFEGLSSVIMGATNESAIEDLLDLDGKNETVMLSLVLG